MAGLVPKNADPERQIPDLLQRFKRHMHMGRFEEAFECMGDMAALSLFMAAREYRQMGRTLSAGELSAMMQNSFRPHQNRGKIQNRVAELSVKVQAALAMRRAEGIRTPEQKQKQADAWMSLALGCAKVIISGQADEMKLAQKEQEQKQPTLVMA